MRRILNAGSPFRWGMAGSLVLGALVRLAYVLPDQRPFVGGDGFTYHLEALRLADGLGYTYSLGAIGAESAHHPPAWVTVLGAFSWLGGRSLLAHQLFTSTIGVALIVVIGLVGRRLFSPRVGVAAAVIAAVYPGFWVLEGQLLSEPLGLLLLGLLILAVVELRDRPSLRASVLVGALAGAVALARAEQLLLLGVLVAPVLYLVRSAPLRQRMAWFAAAVATAAVVIAPWTIYNSTRFDEPVLLSTTAGGALLLGNCPPTTYEGELLGYYDIRCSHQLAVRNLEIGRDRSELDPIYRNVAIHNMLQNLDRLPVTVPARLGRATALFHPSQTVEFVTAWMQTDEDPIWAWVVSFWALIPLAVVGAVRARRNEAFQLPLVAPILVAVFTVATAYGEPRYHTPADLGVVVLAAFGLDGLIRWLRPPRQGTSVAHDQIIQ